MVMRKVGALLLLLLLGCSSAEEPPFVLPSSAKQLLAGDSTKVWKLAQRFNNRTRMNMGDCFLSYRQTFFSGGMVRDNNGEVKGCGETLEAKWTFVKSQQGYYYLRLESEEIPTLMNIEDDFKLFKVLDLTEESMTLQFQHAQFSDKTTTITDFLVPEDVNVEGRTFHW